MTYSIAARDPSTGELGVAVQSQAFNAGAAVPWARPDALRTMSLLPDMRSLEAVLDA